MQKVIFKLVLALGFCLSVSAYAVPTLIKNDGIYYGATGIEVNNISYDVEFVDGVFGNIFSTNNWTPFASEADVWLANSQLHSLVVAEPALDFDPSLTFGCSSLSGCYILSPIASRADDGAYVFGELNPLHSYLRSAASINGAGVASGSDFEGVNDSYLYIDTKDWVSFVWAKWSFSSVDVPESSTLVLLIFGLMLLFGRRYLTK